MVLQELYRLKIVPIGFLMQLVYLNSVLEMVFGMDFGIYGILLQLEHHKVAVNVTQLVQQLPLHLILISKSYIVSVVTS